MPSLLRNMVFSEGCHPGIALSSAEGLRACKFGTSSEVSSGMLYRRCHLLAYIFLNEIDSRCILEVVCHALIRAMRVPSVVTAILTGRIS